MNTRPDPSRSIAFRISKWIGLGIFLMLEFVVLFLLAFTAKEIWGWLW